MIRFLGIATLLAALHLAVGVNCVAQRNGDKLPLRLVDAEVVALTNSADTSIGFWVSGIRGEHSSYLGLDTDRVLSHGRLIGRVRYHRPDSRSRMSDIDSALVVVGALARKGSWARPMKNSTVTLVAVGEEFCIDYNTDIGTHVWVIGWLEGVSLGSIYSIEAIPQPIRRR